MGVDQTSLDRIRNATFPTARRGYEKREVERFLARLADWLETGAGDESRSDAVKRELERVGQRTGAILAQAEESGQQIRAEAEEEARKAVAEANAAAEKTRSEADAYSEQTRKEADGYAEKTRAEADRRAREEVDGGQAQARRIVEEGSKRRRDIESVIADLVNRRNEVLEDIAQLGDKLTTAVTEHRPKEGDDPFAEPDEYDPLAGQQELSEQGEEEEGDRLPEEKAETAEPEESESEELAAATEKRPDAGSKKERRRRRVEA